MGKNSSIQWCDHTFNPWIGCTRVHAGCANCYAEADMANRRGRVVWGPNGTRSRTSGGYWRQPLAWDREAARDGKRRRVFCASFADVFETWTGPILNHRREFLLADGTTTTKPPDRMVALTMEMLRNGLFDIIDRTPHLDWLLLTKRPFLRTTP